MTTTTNDAARVASINGRHWPAELRDDGLLIDLRLFSPDGQLTYRPEGLREADVPEDLVQAARDSRPQGFVLLAG
jgi:hypothetical protein